MGLACAGLSGRGEQYQLLVYVGISTMIIRCDVGRSSSVNRRMLMRNLLGFPSQRELANKVRGPGLSLAPHCSPSVVGRDQIYFLRCACPQPPTNPTDAERSARVRRDRTARPRYKRDLRAARLPKPSSSAPLICLSELRADHMCVHADQNLLQAWRQQLVVSVFAARAAVREWHAMARVLDDKPPRTQR